MRKSCRVRIKFLLTSYQQTTHSTYFTRRLCFFFYFFCFLSRQMLSKHRHIPRFTLPVTQNYLSLPVLFFVCGQRHSKTVVKHSLLCQETCSSIKTEQVMNGCDDAWNKRKTSWWPLGAYKDLFLPIASILRWIFTFLHAYKLNLWRCLPSTFVCYYMYSCFWVFLLSSKQSEKGLSLLQIYHHYKHCHCDISI